MKKLKIKTFITIYSIFTVILVTVLATYNIKNYQTEKNHVKDNLTKMFRRGPERMDDHFIDPNIENKIVMDYEVYTVLLDKDNNIFDTIYHSEEESNFDIDKIASKILKNNKEDNIKINNLYFSNYSYNYQSGEYLIVVNTKDIKKRLNNVLIESIIIFIILELLIILITKYLTNWIVKPAEESFKKQKEFIADASHELKTPLSVIMASTDALKSDGIDNKYLDNISSESDRMNKLIKDLLDLSKLENETLVKSYENNNLSKIVEKSALTFEGIAFEQGIEIKTDIKENISFKCNSDDITKLLGILLDNAIKHSDKDKAIEVNLNTQKDKIVLEVINYGDEIKEEDLDKIFERFYRVDKGRNRKENRYGLGLAIAKSIVINHDGKIEATSSNHQTIFKVTFKK